MASTIASKRDPRGRGRARALQALGAAMAALSESLPIVPRDSRIETAAVQRFLDEVARWSAITPTAAAAELWLLDDGQLQRVAQWRAGAETSVSPHSVRQTGAKLVPAWRTGAETSVSPQTGPAREGGLTPEPHDGRPAPVEQALATCAPVIWESGGGATDVVIPIRFGTAPAGVIIVRSCSSVLAPALLEALEVLGRFGIAAARAEEARTAERARMRRFELLLNLATLPDLSLEAPATITPVPAMVEEEGAGSAGRAVPAPPVSNDGPRRPSPDLGASLEHIARIIREGLGIERAGILVYDPARGRLVPAVEPAAQEAPLDDAFRELLLEQVIRRGQPLFLSPSSTAPQERDALSALGVRAALAVPLAVEGEPRGVLFVADTHGDAFDAEDLAFLQLLAARVSLLVERAELAGAQRELERQRAQAAARQEFLGIVTHELKTPVAVMRAYTEVLLARAQKRRHGDEVELLERIDDQAERLLKMVEQVLDLQRIDAGLFPLEIARVDLGALAARVAQDLQMANPEVRLQVRVDSAGSPSGRIEVRADRRRIEQVLTNLIQNAVRFSPPGGVVDIWVRLGSGEPVPAAGPSLATGPEEPARARFALVSVRDQGPGVSEADRARIFDRFYQGKGGERLHRGHGGLGVGLYIAREIVTRHGGDLWLEPAQPEAGATFTFSLPVLGPHETA